MTNAASASSPAWKWTAPWLRFLLIAILGVGLDLYTKEWAFPEGVARVESGKLAEKQGLFPDPRSPKVLVPSVLVLQTIANEGAVFGIGQGQRSVFLIFSVLAMGLISWLFITSKREQIWLHIALGLILAGALGNLYDRARWGAVRDLLMFPTKWYPWIFNIADVLLCIGVPLLVICWMFTKEHPKKESRPVAG